MDERETNEDFVGRVDERSGELMKEAKFYISKTPKAERGHVFESWVIQKLAAIQILVESLTGQVRELGEVVDSERSGRHAEVGRRPGKLRRMPRAGLVSPKVKSLARRPAAPASKS